MLPLADQAEGSVHDSCGVQSEMIEQELRLARRSNTCHPKDPDRYRVVLRDRLRNGAAKAAAHDSLLCRDDAAGFPRGLENGIFIGRLEGRDIEHTC